MGKDRRAVIVAAIGLIVIYLILYYLLGFATMYVVGGRRACNPLWIGMFVYAILFFLEALPMKLIQMPLRVVGYIWMGTVLGLVVLILFYLHREIYSHLKEWAGMVWQHRWVALLVLAVVAFALVYTETERQVGSPWDSSYYLGEVNTSVYEGTMETVDAINGRDLNSFNVLYMMETYLMHSAVVCTLTGMPALVELRTVMTAVLVLAFFALMWDIGRRLFGKEYWKSGVLLLVILVVYLFSNSYFWPGAFLLTRTYEGKTILANLFVPAAFYWFMSLWDEDTRENWVGLFLTMTACFTYSMSSIFIMPVALAGYGVVLLCHRRNWQTVGKIAICLMPCLMAAACYVLMGRGIISVSIY